ncbi:hypothetical protein [Noviherbaspirillum malthae]|uniref:hypothetical protein n=1 Tax=Noviherbaspirillum malthae TaxID=1260987 RepID=UPI00188FA2CA|nr:hypothetical protein [Noviherbaspirillum malthae]
MDINYERIKRLDLLGGVGAGVLGAGIALLFASSLQPFAVPALLIGILAHGWAMYAKGKLVRQAKVEQPKWVIVAEWACWLMLTGLVFYVALAART